MLSILLSHLDMTENGRVSTNSRQCNCNIGGCKYVGDCIYIVHLITSLLDTWVLRYQTWYRFIAVKGAGGSKRNTSFVFAFKRVHWRPISWKRSIHYSGIPTQADFRTTLVQFLVHVLLLSWRSKLGEGGCNSTNGHLRPGVQMLSLFRYIVI